MNSPLDMLQHCHRNIRRFSSGLVRLAEVEHLDDPAVIDGVRACARYFREGLPLHAQDEDLSLTPRLEQLSLRPQEISALWQMFTQHQQIDTLTAEVLAMLDAVVTQEPVDRMGFLGLARELRTLLMAHIELEEAVLFPRILELPPRSLTSMVREMRTRRGLPAAPLNAPRVSRPGLPFRIVSAGALHPASQRAFADSNE
ncbi:MAG: hemerythrin domain-containing protein [Myxococcales bacterium]|nr:hemerythrin domain-containing protein [Myxococcales bacterium]